MSNSSPDSPLRWGIVGCGDVVERKGGPSFQQLPGSQLVAVMRRSAEKIEAYAKANDIPLWTTDAQQVIAHADADMVYVATPPANHQEYVIAAARAGKHVLCEKPLTMTAAQGEEVVAVCREQGVFLQEGYMMKFHGAHRVIRDKIAAGDLGRIVYMRAQLSCWYPPIEGAWRQDPASGGGGSLIDMATHLYDLLEFFAGPIRRVAALVGNLVQDYKSEDAATTLLEFQNGAHATVDTFFCIPDEASRTRLEIYGSRGAILTEGTIGQSRGGAAEGVFGLGDAAYDAAQNKDVTRVLEPIEFPRLNPYTEECRYFADCILRGQAPEINNGDNALHVLRVTEQAYASARNGCFQTV